jgi:hypothetical protein
VSVALWLDEQPEDLGVIGFMYRTVHLRRHINVAVMMSFLYWMLHLVYIHLVPSAT